MSKLRQKAWAYKMSSLRAVTIVAAGQAEVSWVGWTRSISVPVLNIKLGRQDTPQCNVLTLTFSPTDPMGPTPPGGPCGPCSRRRQCFWDFQNNIHDVEPLLATVNNLSQSYMVKIICNIHRMNQLDIRTSAPLGPWGPLGPGGPGGPCRNEIQ